MNEMDVSDTIALMRELPALSIRQLWAWAILYAVPVNTARALLQCLIAQTLHLLEGAA